MMLRKGAAAMTPILHQRPEPVCETLALLYIAENLEDLIRLMAKLLNTGQGDFASYYHMHEALHRKYVAAFRERAVYPGEWKAFFFHQMSAGEYVLMALPFLMDQNLIFDAESRREAELNNLKIVEEEEFSIAIDFAPCKCVLVSDDEEALRGLENHWKRRLDGVLDVFPSEPYFLEVVPCGVDKANTLALLMEQLGVTREEVIAFGDGVADVTMLQLAGKSVAMGHAPDSVKVCADYVTASNEEDGVAQAVEKLILSEVHASEIPLDLLNAQAKHALMGNLGIQYTYASPDRIEATMPVDERTRQPFGILHGGATLALAETVAGLGSMITCQPDEIVVGMQVSGNHVSSAHEGDTVRAVGTIVHRGRSSHVWNVDVFTSTNKLVSSIRVVNSIMKKR